MAVADFWLSVASSYSGIHKTTPQKLLSFNFTLQCKPALLSLNCYVNLQGRQSADIILQLSKIFAELCSKQTMLFKAFFPVARFGKKVVACIFVLVYGTNWTINIYYTN